jgi:hypothetical protein
VSVPAASLARNESAPPGPRPRAVAAGVVAGWSVLVAVFWLGLFVASMRPGVFSPEAIDLYGYFLPKFAYGSAELAHGRLPLWNPYEYAGLPFLGEAQPAVLYPPRIVLFGLVSSPSRALHLFMIAHYVLLGAGAWLLLRVFGVRPAGAWFGAILLTFQPLMMSSHYHPPRLACFAWVPLIVAAFVRTMERPALAPALGLAVAAACQALAGYPEYSVDTAIALVVLWPAAAAAAARNAPAGTSGVRAIAAGTGRVAAAAAVAVALTAPQWVSLLALWRDSVRATGGITFMAGQQPRLEGPGLLGWMLAISNFAYVPPLASVAQWGGTFGPRRPYRLALLALWVLASIAFTGPVRALPPFSLFRSFLCWSTIAYVPLAVLAGMGFERLLAVAAGARPRVGEAIGWLLGLGLALPLVGGRAAAWLLLGTGALLAARVAGRHVRVAGGAAVACTLLAIWTWIPVALPAGLPHRYAAGQVPYPARTYGRDQGEALRAACGDGAGRIVALPEVLGGVPVVTRLPALPGYPHTLAPARMHRLLEVAGLASDGLALDWTRLATAGAALARLDVGCLVVSPGHETTLAAIGYRARQALPDGRVAWVPAVPAVRARIAAAVRVVPDEAAALAAVTASGTPLDAVVLEAAALPGGAPAAAGGAGRAAIAAEEAGRLSVAVDVPAGGWLVVSENHLPGWRARVDGRDAPVLRGDWTFLAVPLAAGARRVELWYRPPAFGPALALALLGAAILVAGGLRCSSRSSSSPSSPR